MHGVCVSVRLPAYVIPFCPSKEAQDYDTKEGTGYCDSSNFLTHTYTDLHTGPGIQKPPTGFLFYNSSLIFLRGQMSSSGVTGRQRADRARPASRTPAWKQSNCYCSIHNSSMTLLAGFTAGFTHTVWSWTRLYQQHLPGLSGNVVHTFIGHPFLVALVYDQIPMTHQPQLCFVFIAN